MWCFDTCAVANNGACQDGGPGSLYALYGTPAQCDPGTDCTDCGRRYMSPPSPPPLSAANVTAAFAASHVVFQYLRSCQQRRVSGFGAGLSALTLRLDSSM